MTTRSRYTSVITDNNNEWWNAIPGCVVAYQPKGALDYPSSKINLANPGLYNASEGTAPSWDKLNGWVGGGSAYLNTGYVISDITHSVFVRFTNAPAASSVCIIGTFNGGNQKSLYIRPDTGTASVFFYASGSTSGTMTRATNGVIGISGSNPFLDGVDLGTINIAGTDAGILPLFIMCINLNGSAAQFFTGNIQAFALYKSVATTEQVVSLTNAMNAL